MIRNEFKTRSSCSVRHQSGCFDISYSYLYILQLDIPDLITPRIPNIRMNPVMFLSFSFMLFSYTIIYTLKEAGSKGRLAPPFKSTCIGFGTFTCRRISGLGRPHAAEETRFFHLPDTLHWSYAPPPHAAPRPSQPFTAPTPLTTIQTTHTGFYGIGISGIKNVRLDLRGISAEGVSLRVWLRVHVVGFVWVEPHADSTPHWCR